jgi:hypothetical protein
MLPVLISYLQYLTVLHSVFCVLPTLHDAVASQQHKLQNVFYKEITYNRITVFLLGFFDMAKIRETWYK